MGKNVCCFIGHRETKETEKIKGKIRAAVESLIVNENVDTFLFGSKSRFNDLCYETVTEIKEKHPRVKRVYVRAEYQHISEDYRAYLLQSYEDTYFPESIAKAGRARYVERNTEMINKSDFCVIHCDEKNMPATRKSGAATALKVAEKMKKRIIWI